MNKTYTINLVQDGKVLGIAHRIEADLISDPKGKAHGKLSYVEMYGNYNLEEEWKIILASIDDDNGDRYIEFNYAILFPDGMISVSNSALQQTRNGATFEKVPFVSELPKIKRLGKANLCLIV